MVQRLKRLPPMQETRGSIPGLGRSPGEGDGNPLQYFPGESHGPRSLVGYSPQGHKESDTTEQLTFTFTSGSDGKESARNAGDPGLIPGSGRSLGEGNDNPLQYSCLENTMDR